MTFSSDDSDQDLEGGSSGGRDLEEEQESEREDPPPRPPPRAMAQPVAPERLGSAGPPASAPPAPGGLYGDDRNELVDGAAVYVERLGAVFSGLSGNLLVLHKVVVHLLTPGEGAGVEGLLEGRQAREVASLRRGLGDELDIQACLAVSTALAGIKGVVLRRSGFGLGLLDEDACARISAATARLDRIHAFVAAVSAVKTAGKRRDTFSEPLPDTDGDGTGYGGQGGEGEDGEEGGRARKRRNLVPCLPYVVTASEANLDQNVKFQAMQCIVMYAETAGLRMSEGLSGALFEKQKVRLRDGRAFQTNAWCPKLRSRYPKVAFTLEDLIMQCFSFHSRPDFYEKVVLKNLVGDVKQALLRGDFDVVWARVAPHRSVICFENGLLDLRVLTEAGSAPASDGIPPGEFHSFPEAFREWEARNPGVEASNLFRCPFPEGRMEGGVTCDDRAACAGIRKIFSAQYPEEEAAGGEGADSLLTFEFWLALDVLSSLNFGDLGVKCANMFVMGQRGSGKSVLVDYLKAKFPIDKVYSLNMSGQQDFAIAGLESTHWLAITTECSTENERKLPRDKMLKLGENADEITVINKNKDQKSVDVSNLYSAFCSNFPLLRNDEAFNRRYFTFNMNVVIDPSQVDTNLPGRLEAERGSNTLLGAKVLARILRLCRERSSYDISFVAPAHILEARRAVLCPVRRFLERENRYVEYGESYTCSFFELRDALRDYVRDMNLCRDTYRDFTQSCSHVSYMCAKYGVRREESDEGADNPNLAGVRVRV
jgi:hypothetical protein